MSAIKDYVRTDEHGVMRIGETRVMLDSVLAAFAQGHSPETIRSQYPALSLEEVYGAITYYLAHQEHVREYLRKQEGAWARWEREFESSARPLLDRLRAARAAGTTT